MRHLSRAGIAPDAKISTLFGVGKSGGHAVISGKAWAHVPMGREPQ